MMEWLKQISFQEWLRETRAYFTSMGFLEDYIGDSDQEFMDKLSVFDVFKTYTTPIWHLERAKTRQEAEAIILGFDEDRVYTNGDTECVYENGYTDVFLGLSRISEGEFFITPESLIEDQGLGLEDHGHVFAYNRRIHFVLKNQRNTFFHNQDLWESDKTQTDRIDMDVIPFVNALLPKECPKRFEWAWGVNLEFYILFLSAEEKRKMVQERGWRFAPNVGGHVL